MLAAAAGRHARTQQRMWTQSHPGHQASQSPLPSLIPLPRLLNCPADYGQSRLGLSCMHGTWEAGRQGEDRTASGMAIRPAK